MSHTTDPVLLEIMGQTIAAEVTFTPPPATSRNIPSPSQGVEIPVMISADDWHKFVEFHKDPITVECNPATGETIVSFDAEATSSGEEPIPVRVVVTWTPPRHIFAAVALDGSGVWAIGDTEQEARAEALSRRHGLRDPIIVGDDFPSAETDAAWLDTLALVTLSGTTESLRALIKSMETGDPVAPWCPADLWDSGEVTP